MFGDEQLEELKERRQIMEYNAKKNGVNGPRYSAEKPGQLDDWMYRQGLGNWNAKPNPVVLERAYRRLKTHNLTMAERKRQLQIEEARIELARADQLYNLADNAPMTPGDYRSAADRRTRLAGAIIEGLKR